MANSKPSVRFDHREVAVIFSLFVFVSLLMFTLGIVVGKGLSNAKFERLAEHAVIGGGAPHSETDATHGKAAHHDSGHANPDHTAPHHAATDNHAVPSHHPAPEQHATETAHHNPHVAAPHQPTTHEQPHEPTAHPETTAHLEQENVADTSHHAPPTQEAHTAAAPAARQEPEPFVPLDPKAKPSTDLHVQTGTLGEPTQATNTLLTDPKILALVEPDPSRQTASVKSSGSVTMPPSFEAGPYSVQVGSYPTKKGADQRVAHLQKQGFPFAYMTVKTFKDNKETWYRVWLGYFPDRKSANLSGKALQKQGEVTQYIVHKSN